MLVVFLLIVTLEDQQFLGTVAILDLLKNGDKKRIRIIGQGFGPGHHGVGRLEQWPGESRISGFDISGRQRLPTAARALGNAEAVVKRLAVRTIHRGPHRDILAEVVFHVVMIPQRAGFLTGEVFHGRSGQ